MKYAYRLETRKVKEPDFPYSSELLNSPETVVAFVRALQDSDIEKMMVLFLNSRNRLICVWIQPGTINSAVVYAREIAKHAILSGAVAVILVHNHPTGDPQPSQEDKALTKGIADALNLLQIIVFDHILLGENSHFSFKENQIL